MVDESGQELLQLEQHSPESLLSWIESLDGWELRESGLIKPPQFPYQAVEIIKTRPPQLPASIHFSLEDRAVYKIPNDLKLMSRLEKEERGWRKATQVFGISKTAEMVELPQIRTKKGKPLQALKMPYVGAPIAFWEKVAGVRIPRKPLEEFVHGMVQLAREHGFGHYDLNPRNILVSVVNGEIRLLPIDWESAPTKTNPAAREKLAEQMWHITQKALQPFYPEYFPLEQSTGVKRETRTDDETGS